MVEELAWGTFEETLGIFIVSYHALKIIFLHIHFYFWGYIFTRMIIQILWNSKRYIYHTWITIHVIRKQMKTNILILYLLESTISHQVFHKPVQNKNTTFGGFLCNNILQVLTTQNSQTHSYLVRKQIQNISRNMRTTTCLYLNWFSCSNKVHSFCSVVAFQFLCSYKLTFLDSHSFFRMSHCKNVILFH